MICELLTDIQQLDLTDYHEVLFNLYEDENAYSIEVVFDDDSLILGREDKYYNIADKTLDFNTVLNNAGLILKTYFKDNKDKYTHFKSIAYGFADGDTLYIRKPKKKKKPLTRFSKEDFYSFDSMRLYAWLTVYLNNDGREKYQKTIFMTDFNKISKEEFEYWCGILAQYFDYNKYNE